MGDPQGEGAQATSVAPGIKSIWNSTWRIGGRLGWAYAFHQDKASSVRVPVENVTLFSSVHLLQENTDLFPIFATGVPVGSVFLLGLLVPAIDA
ncbi:hypothetical protein Tco_1190995, partial [Tanacetum coccineum]